MVKPRSFSVHLRRLNARRLRLASWYFALLVALLLLANVVLPSLQLWLHAVVQAIALAYFVALGFVCRSPGARGWPTPALPLLFGLGAAATGLIFSVDLTFGLGANPAYATTVFLACVAPLWPRRLLLAVLAPVHVVYLLIVFLVGQGMVFVLLMGIGGSVAAALGWLVAVLQYRTERHAFETAATIRQQKDELTMALERVSRLLDERSEMVATVAHDLQSPLAGMRALLRTIPDRPDGDGAKLREIARTCADMQGAITRLIEAHAAEGDEVAFEIVDLETLFADAAATVAATAAEKSMTLARDAAHLSVRAEPLLLARALGNLLSNAVKFSPAGSVVRLQARSHGTGVRIAVIDRGPGIAADEAPMLFRKFRPLSAQPTGGEATSGLGLYIVHSLMRRMHATAGFEPNPEGGSVFFLELAAADAVTPSRSSAP
jgi:signal transduction histidine kinase